MKGRFRIGYIEGHNELQKASIIIKIQLINLQWKVKSSIYIVIVMLTKTNGIFWAEANKFFIQK